MLIIRDVRYNVISHTNVLFNVVRNVIYNVIYNVVCNVIYNVIRQAPGDVISHVAASRRFRSCVHHVATRVARLRSSRKVVHPAKSCETYHQTRRDIVLRVLPRIAWRRASRSVSRFA